MMLLASLGSPADLTGNSGRCIMPARGADNEFKGGGYTKLTNSPPFTTNTLSPLQVAPTQLTKEAQGERETDNLQL